VIDKKINAWPVTSPNTFLFTLVDPAGSGTAPDEIITLLCSPLPSRVVGFGTQRFATFTDMKQAYKHYFSSLIQHVPTEPPLKHYAALAPGPYGDRVTKSILDALQESCPGIVCEAFPVPKASLHDVVIGTSLASFTSDGTIPSVTGLTDLLHAYFTTPLREDKTKEGGLDTTLPWRHYSSNHLCLRNVRPNPCAYKPQGLYCAQGTRWVDWCEEMGVYPGSYKWVYSIRVKPTARIAKIATFTDIRHWQTYRKDYDGCWVTDDAIAAAKRAFQPGRSMLGWVAALDVETLVVWNATQLVASHGARWNRVEEESEGTVAGEGQDKQE
jgi:hypothetical protein